MNEILAIGDYAKAMSLVFSRLPLAALFAVSSLLSACEHDCTLELRASSLRFIDENGNPATPTNVVIKNAKGNEVMPIDFTHDGDASVIEIPESGSGTYTVEATYCGRMVMGSGDWRADGECHADGPDDFTINVGKPCT